ncbi:hypothetical protein HDV57DRAFT_178086 [Trichoderma longibrachiatum]|uniref:Uncharacterized protein n=1 Tax=Trichoderma longibrachiatum ATCC 18648 TaxID=983965 RepID=A0A2T4CAQ3_TRILO|nr:hypothetical protein M440DRAFT_1198357 [Trichoderma longibrachiatum ATCC 18648]
MMLVFMLSEWCGGRDQQEVDALKATRRANTASNAGGTNKYCLFARGTGGYDSEGFTFSNLLILRSAPPPHCFMIPRTVLHGRMGFLWCCRGSRSCVSSTSQTPACSSFGSPSPACKSGWSMSPYVARHQRRHYALIMACVFTFHATPLWRLGSALPARPLHASGICSHQYMCNGCTWDEV